MSTRRVRVNSVYHYVPVGMDRFNPPVNAPEKGTLVRVINLYGCPPANTMGQCYVEVADSKELVGMVCCNSLIPKKEYVPDPKPAVG